MIGIIAALSHEMELITKKMDSPVTETVGGVTFVKGKVNGRELVCSVCGVGKVFAAMCAEAMIIRYSPEVIINTGVGGTLTRELSIGDVAVSSAVCQHDMDTTALGDEPGLISGTGKVFFESDKAVAEKIIAIAKSSGANVVHGVIASGDKFIASACDKERITSQFGAVVCEMEGAAIGHVCYVNGVPFAVVRAISDDADGGACEDYPSFAARSAERSAEFVFKFAEEY